MGIRDHQLDAARPGARFPSNFHHERARQPAQPGGRAAEPVWAADIAYLPIGRGFLYLVAIIDGASRAVLAWRLSTTMDIAFRLAALEEALARFGKPEIFNAGQPIHQRRLHRHAGGGRRAHLDGRAGGWIDNLFIERVWRRLKYQDIYLEG